MRAIPTSAFAAVSIASHTSCAHLGAIIALVSTTITLPEYRGSRACPCPRRGEEAQFVLNAFRRVEPGERQRLHKSALHGSGLIPDHGCYRSRRRKRVARRGLNDGHRHLRKPPPRHAGLNDRYRREPATGPAQPPPTPYFR